MVTFAFQVSLSLYNNKDYVDLSDYWKSGTWDIIEVPAYLNVHNESSPNIPTETDITFYITIRRKTLFYTVNLILPTVLISFLCVLVFYLPAEAGEKVTLGISILLSLVVFLLLVSKILPPTSLVLPLIAKYLLFTFIMNTVSILVTVVIINWNFRCVTKSLLKETTCCHMYIQLQGTKDPLDAKLDKDPVPQVLAYFPFYAPTQKDQTPMDDGDPRHIQKNTTRAPTYDRRSGRRARWYDEHAGWTGAPRPQPARVSTGKKPTK